MLIDSFKREKAPNLSRLARVRWCDIYSMSKASTGYGFGFVAHPSACRCCYVPFSALRFGPVAAVEASVGHGFGYVVSADGVSLLEVGNGACHLDDASVGTG